jgi:predicted DNA-binding mobile mystery protein A
VKVFEQLAVSQLDKILKPFSQLLMFQPNKGWIRIIRQTLRMSTSSLAKRLKVSNSVLIAKEMQEANKSISLQTLEEVAEALECRLVYALVPKRSFHKMIQQQVQNKATALVAQTQQTLGREQQVRSENSNPSLHKQIELACEHLQSGSLKALW